MDTGWCGNTKTFAVFDGQTYGVRVRRYAMEHNETGIAVSGDRTYRVPFTNLTVSFPRRVRRHGGSRQGRDGVWQGDRRGRQRPDQVLQGQRIRPERRPGRQDPHTVHCTLDSRTYSVPLGDLGITAAREPALITRLITDRLGIRVSTLVSLLARLLYSLL
jgi:hypothetical protein